MNVDIVNKQVATTTGIKERDVALVNGYFWHRVREHIYSYSPQPLNITNVCVFYNNAYTTRMYILALIRRIRKIKVNKRYNPLKPMRQRHIDLYNELIRKVWRVRKINKYV